ncbi:uncharacterized protein LOC109846292 [Asparagus officinalis]|uniref:uncharacterized protein LOC109846292 n=1 Tax=Asparagus officinalis TaxID=4686 RepID=UPI00098E3C09|nr:uncharacterized protein LOC109846292 [Asparagus officinalis]
MCGKLKISHLIFADDLLLFAKGDLYSIQKLYQCVKDFSDTTGLEANLDKCSIYFGGVDDAIKTEIKDFLGFSEGAIPFRYLGVPLICKRLTHVDCNPLLDSISNQFQKWSRHSNLSYAGKIQVIKSVILGIQNFWTSNFILPVKVVKKIDEVCRQFLWEKSENSSKTPLVSWDKVCCGRSQGGLGVYSAAIWNLATAMRSMWYIHVNKEILWVKWIHGNYLKQNDVWNVKTKRGDSWMWKQLLKCRDKALHEVGGIDNLKKLLNDCYKNLKIKLSAVYTAFSPAIKVPWFSTVWGNLNYPRHSFVLWLAVLNRDVWLGIINWLRTDWQTCYWNLLMNWYITRQRGKGFKTRVKRLVLAAAVYRIWEERNRRCFQQKCRNPDQLVMIIKTDIFTICLNSNITAEQEEWLVSL